MLMKFVQHLCGVMQSSVKCLKHDNVLQQSLNEKRHQGYRTHDHTDHLKTSKEKYLRKKGTHAHDIENISIPSKVEYTVT